MDLASTIVARQTETPIVSRPPQTSKAYVAPQAWSGQGGWSYSLTSDGLMAKRGDGPAVRVSEASPAYASIMAERQAASPPPSPQPASRAPAPRIQLPEMEVIGVRPPKPKPVQDPWAREMDKLSVPTPPEKTKLADDSL